MWSAGMASSPTIRVQIQLTSIVPVKFVRKDENKQKRDGDWPIF